MGAAGEEVLPGEHGLCEDRGLIQETPTDGGTDRHTGEGAQVLPLGLALPRVPLSLQS